MPLLDFVELHGGEPVSPQRIENGWPGLPQQPEQAGAKHIFILSFPLLAPNKP
jgi:hypothetical protein